MLLRAHGITKRYGSRTVLRDVRFTVRENEILGLIGPNGAGKTTLFECLARMIPVDGGALDAAPLFYMPDSIRPWPAQRVEWALDFFARLHGKPAALTAQLAESLQLTSLLRSRIGSLSKGESKRLLVALGLLTPQPLLLLDEPFDGLDFRQTRDVMTLLRTIPAQGRTLFLSIHQLGDAARICDRLVLLSRGQIAGEGTLDDLRAQANLRDGGLEEVFLALT